MIPVVYTTEMLISGLAPLRKFLFVFLALTIIVVVYKKICKLIKAGLTRSYCYVSGCSMREARKTVKQVGNVIDLVSTLNDLNDTGKKK